MNSEKISWSALAHIIAEAQEHFGVDSIDYLLEELECHPNNVAITDSCFLVDLFFEEDGDESRNEIDRRNY